MHSRRWYLCLSPASDPSLSGIALNCGASSLATELPHSDSHRDGHAMLSGTYHS